MTKTEDALMIRDLARRVLGAKGQWQSVGKSNFLTVQETGLRILLRTPFQKFPQPDERMKFLVAARDYKLNMPYGLDIWAPLKVLNLEWDDDGSVEVITFKRGEWEAQLATLAA
jgi:hypothetical protein